MNTTIAVNTVGWIVRLEEDNRGVFSTKTVYFKYLPTIIDNVLAIEDATYVDITGVYRANLPITPARLVGTRSGSNIELSIFPVDITKNETNDAVDTAPPYNDNFEVNSVLYNTSIINYVSALEQTYTVKTIRDGVKSSSISITIPVSDGVYYSNKDMNIY